MRKLIISMHTTLDGFVAGPEGEMDWIKLDEAMFDFVGKLTREADTALYGRVTYEMMDSYWPTAGNEPGASRHDVEHSRWYNSVEKVVLSRTMVSDTSRKVTVIRENITEEITRLKQRKGRNILIFGSPSAAHALMAENLIDEYWLFVNPVILGKGIPLFEGVRNKILLRPLETKVFACGVTGLGYHVER